MILMESNPEATWNEIAVHFPGRTAAAVKVRGTSMSKKASSDNLEMSINSDNVEERPSSSSTSRVASLWTKEDVSLVLLLMFSLFSFKCVMGDSG